MPIPKEILAVERPKNTVVRKSGERYLVIKRTCRRVGKRNLPVDLGTIGEIVNGAYIEKRKEPRKRRIDVKDYGEVALCDKAGRDMLQELAKVWDMSDAKRLYVMALLRACFPGAKDRDLQMHYETSYASEWYPGVHLSENSVSSFLLSVGQNYSAISEFMRNRVAALGGGRMVIDGMLKDCNSDTGSLSEFSRKGAKKGSRDISLMYAYDPDRNEPIAVKPYPGNMLDQTAVGDFISEFNIKKGMMIIDRGFLSEAMLDAADKEPGLSYVIPLKRDSALIARYGMDSPAAHLSGYKEATVLYRKERMADGKYLYSFRDPRIASEQEAAYVQNATRKGRFSEQAYADRKAGFGLVVFKSKSDLDPLALYLAYAQRWVIEVLFNMFKNIIDRDTVNVHGDYRTYATELVNFLSAVIASRVKNMVVKYELNKRYSLRQVFKYLAKYKKVRTSEDGTWQTAVNLKYIGEIIEKLGI